MIIRKAKPKDARKISNLRIKTIQKINGRDYNKKQIRILVNKNKPKNIIEKIKNRNMFCLINKNRILGVINLEENKIGGLFIRHNCVGKGYGRKLLVFTENYAKKRKINKTKLYSTITAYNFYIKNGYKLKKKGTWSPEKGVKFTTYKMEKNLKCKF